MKSTAAAACIRNWLPCSSTPLGSGSSACVSLALSLDHAGLMPFALKTPLSPSSSASLLNELFILLPLSSPFILRCLGADLAPDGTPRHLFLEFMEGGSLASLLKRSGDRLEEPLVRRYTRSIVEGLQYLHRNGIVHCDIKAHNILIGSSGAKIADFGAAKRVGPSSDEEGIKGSESGSQLRGTPLWMAPEVVEGVEQGFPSDIWSLGCTVVELLQGRPPWGYVSDLGAVLFKLGCSEEEPPLPESISDAARDFLLRCLHRDPKARWTASELLQHPFLCDITAITGDYDEVKQEQFSPRSTLDFLHDSEDGCDSSTLSSLCFQSSVAKPPQLAAAINSTAPSLKRQFTEAFSSNEDEWMTVKRVASCCREMKRMPFMKTGCVPIRTGCDVSLEAAEFLKGRKVVG